MRLIPTDYYLDLTEREEVAWRTFMNEWLGTYEFESVPEVSRHGEGWAVGCLSLRYYLGEDQRFHCDDGRAQAAVAVFENAHEAVTRLCLAIGCGPRRAET